MAEPVITVTGENVPSSAEADAVRDLAFTEWLNGPITLIAPLFAAWVFVRHHRRAKAALAGRTVVPASTVITDAVASVVALDDARGAKEKRRHG